MRLTLRTRAPSSYTLERMSRFTVQGTNNPFTCLHCGREVLPLENGSVRNHCPHCLYSLHVDVFPGDRASECGGLLEPIGVEQSPKKGWVLLHRCQQCGFEGRNKAAPDDPVQPDDYGKILELSRKTVEDKALQKALERPSRGRKGRG